MAQKVNIVLIDDLDGSEATQTVAFSLDGTHFEIDLNDDNAAALRNAVTHYAENARKVGRNQSGRTSGRRGGRNDSPSANEIRSWAQMNGLEVPARGRVPAHIRQTFREVH